MVRPAAGPQPQISMRLHDRMGNSTRPLLQNDIYLFTKRYISFVYKDIYLSIKTYISFLQYLYMFLVKQSAKMVASDGQRCGCGCVWNYFSTFAENKVDGL